MTDLRILATTDFSDRSERALQRAALLAEGASAAVTVLHVVDDAAAEPILRAQAGQATEALTRAVHEAALPDGTATEIRIGAPAQEIMHRAEALDAAVVVMGCYRRMVHRDVFVGTTIERVMRLGRTPVLMVNAEAAAPYRHVMLATDMSQGSADAISAAKALGLLDVPRLSLLHAAEPLAEGMILHASIDRRGDAPGAGDPGDSREAVEAFAASLDLGGHRYDLRIEAGPAYRTIKSVADNVSPDLLVIGTRSMGGRHDFLGSVAASVLRTVECDILAVPPQTSPG